MQVETATDDDPVTGLETELAPQGDAGREAETERGSIAASRMTPVTSIEAAAKALLTPDLAAKATTVAFLAGMHPAQLVPRKRR